MNPEIRKKWIEALESGDYLRGKGFLRKKADNEKVTKHCCLGVLVDLVEPESWKETKRKPSDDFSAWSCGKKSKVQTSAFGAVTTVAFPKAGFLKKVGLEKGDAEYLASLNDRANDNDLSFSSVINYIIENC